VPLRWHQAFLLVHALVLSKSLTTKRAVEVTQSACVTKLELANAELRAKLEQARSKITEADECHKFLSFGYVKLQDEVDGLHEAVETLKQEIAKAETNREAEVTTICMKFQDYCLRHRRKLRDVWFHLEKAVNEFGARCLPFPGKRAPSAI
jgi:chromosome segregation ATPase